jgi:hypothetical protein
MRSLYAPCLYLSALSYSVHSDLRTNGQGRHRLQIGHQIRHRRASSPVFSFAEFKIEARVRCTTASAATSYRWSRASRACWLSSFPDARRGSFLRLTLAIFSSSLSLIDSTICREAPRSFDFGCSPRASDQQKWIPVLRPVARQLNNLAHDLIGEPVSTSPDHAPPRAPRRRPSAAAWIWLAWEDSSGCEESM